MLKKMKTLALLFLGVCEQFILNRCMCAVYILIITIKYIL